MSQTFTIEGKKVSIHPDGHIFVDGKCTGIKQWKSSSTTYSNLSGQEQKDLKGKTVYEALAIRGFVPRPWATTNPQKYWGFYFIYIMLNLYYRH